MGRREHGWQTTDRVLGHVGPRAGPARKAYRAFVEAGIRPGRRPESVGGGLLRSLEGQPAGQALARGAARRTGDERILGDTAFVRAVLAASNEQPKRAEKVRRQGRASATGTGRPGWL